MSVIKLDDANFSKEISKGVTLVDFYADWCGPCKMVAPIVNEVANETDIKVFKVDVDSNPITANQFQIMSIPTLIIFKDGNPVDTIVGFAAKEQIIAKINQVK